jgi:predicted NAD-dependent protein-ADP-ribosyltransferase YbiA (DUF1768 family)
VSESRRPHGRGIEERRSLVFNWCGLSLFCSGPPVTQAGQELLSQWYVAPFIVDGLSYPTAEHWMMVEKARLFTDHEAVEMILIAPSPKTPKALGRKVKNFDRTFGQRTVATLSRGATWRSSGSMSRCGSF